MPDIPIWLDRLDRATNYRELQEIFSEIAAQRNPAANMPIWLVLSMRRSAASRPNEPATKQDLQEIQSRYDSFRQETKALSAGSSVTFPSPRRADKKGEFKGDLAQQAAEILADNLVIARAQMLKERFLGPDNRKLGQRPPAWRIRMEAAAADRELAPLGQALKDLDGELERSRPFLARSSTTSTPSAEAAFKTPEDRQRRDADLAGRRQETAELDSRGRRRGGIEAIGTQTTCRACRGRTRRDRRDISRRWPRGRQAPRDARFVPTKPALRWAILIRQPRPWPSWSKK